MHDLFVTFEGMTPGEFKKQGAGLEISYGFSDSPFGDCLLATTKRGICHFGFVKGDNRSDALDQLFETWPGAVFKENPKPVSTIVRRIFEKDQTKNTRPFNLHLKGTNFQKLKITGINQLPTPWMSPAYQR